MSSILHISNTKGKKLQIPDVRNDFDGNWVQNVTCQSKRVLSQDWEFPYSNKCYKDSCLTFFTEEIMLSHFTYF